MTDSLWTPHLPALFLLGAGAYLLGSLSFAVLVSRRLGHADPRSYGSGNPGATNVLRGAGKLAAALTLLGDALKGLVAVVLAWLCLPLLSPEFQADALARSAWLATASVAVFLGHLYPVFFGFRGGKGVATALGILLALSPWLGLAALATWLAMLGLTRKSARSALAAAAAGPVAAGLGLRPDAVLATSQSPIFWAVLVLALLLVWRHRSNIANMRAGLE